MTITKLKIDYEFPSGAKVTGTIEELETIAKSLGVKLDYTKIKGGVPRGYYASESKGLTKIKEMSDYHIRRALIKQSKDYFATVYDSADNNRTFLEKFSGLTDVPVVVDLFTELQTRK